MHLHLILCLVGPFLPLCLDLCPWWQCTFIPLTSFDTYLNLVKSNRLHRQVLCLKLLWQIFSHVAWCSCLDYCGPLCNRVRAILFAFQGRCVLGAQESLWMLGQLLIISDLCWPDLERTDFQLLALGTPDAERGQHSHALGRDLALEFCLLWLHSCTLTVHL